MTNRKIVNAMIQEVKAIGGLVKCREDWNLVQPHYRATVMVRIIQGDSARDDITLKPEDCVEANDEAIGTMVRWLTERTADVQIGRSTGNPAKFRAFCTNRTGQWDYEAFHERQDMALVLLLTNWLRENRDRVEVTW